MIASNESPRNKLDERVFVADRTKSGGYLNRDRMSALARRIQRRGWI